MFSCSVFLTEGYEILKQNKHWLRQKSEFSEILSLHHSVERV